MTANYDGQLIKRTNQHLCEKKDKALGKDVLRLENLQMRTNFKGVDG